MQLQCEGYGLEQNGNASTIRRTMHMHVGGHGKRFCMNKICFLLQGHTIKTENLNKVQMLRGCGLNTSFECFYCDGVNTSACPI